MTTDIKKASPGPLGRGLSALLGETTIMDSENAGAISFLPTVDLKPGKFQPRFRFDDEKLTALIDSIRQKGIVQPLIVRSVKDGNGTYEIIAGERRWRAARTLNLQSVPVFIRECDDRDALETALVENIQRDDLTPVEEAEGYLRLQEEFCYTQEDLARSLGKSRSHIANMLRLNQLPDSVKSMIQEGKLSAGHARTLVNSENVEEMAQNIIANNLNVRQTEKLKREKKQPAGSNNLEIPETEFSHQIKIVENEISRILKLPVNLKVKKSGAALTVQFESYEAIDEFISTLRTLE
jgi:ParB family chromosome partitioning protein